MKKQIRGFMESYLRNVSNEHVSNNEVLNKTGKKEHLRLSSETYC